jgi:hypothetical protein
MSQELNNVHKLFNEGWTVEPAIQIHRSTIWSNGPFNRLTNFKYTVKPQLRLL